MKVPSHRGAGRHLAWALALWTLGSCECASLDPDALFLCRSQADCPEGTRCSEASSLCEPVAGLDGAVVSPVDAGPTPDTGPTGPLDASDSDAEVPDASVLPDGSAAAEDAGAAAPDAGTPDAAEPADAGGEDVGAPDTGTEDVGTPDVGSPDIGSPDVGTPDVGTPDTGLVPDAGAYCDRVGTPCPNGERCCYATNTCTDPLGKTCPKVSCGFIACPPPLQCCPSTTFCYDPEWELCGVVVELCQDDGQCTPPTKCCVGRGNCYDPAQEPCVEGDPCGEVCAKTGQECCPTTKACYDPKCLSCCF